MEILTVYVVFSSLDSVEKWMLMGKASFDFTVDMAKREMGYSVTLIHNDSTLETDPVLEVAFVSRQKPPKEMISGINQSCINFLVEAGFGTPKNGNILWDIEVLRQGMEDA